jgi:transmembrane sensor
VTLVELLLLRALKIVSRPGRPLLLAALGACIVSIPASQRPDPALATQAGEWSTHTLEDGTVATLGPRSVLTYSFDERRRSIHLIGGEALFNVKKDPSRPFVVTTPTGCAKALGTIFSVSHQLRSTAVTTQEGIVAVARLDRADPDCSRNTIRLFAGRKAVIESWTPLVARTVDTSVEHAWTNRQIIFTGQTVEQALGEFNRRNWVQLDMPDDPEVVRMRIMGPFPLDHPERFARYLEKELRWRRSRR